MQQEDQPGWDYRPSGGTAIADKPNAQTGGGAKPPSSNSSMSWTATEYIEHERGASWYLLLIVVTAALAGLAYLISKDYFAIGVIVALGIIVAIAVGRKPRELQYQLDNQGILVGDKSYNYSEFKSFTIIHDGAVSHVELVPLKKLMLPVTAYFGPGDEERIMDIIGQHLPYEQRQMAAIDRLSRKLRF